MTSDVFRFINPYFRCDQPVLHDLYKFQVIPTKEQLKTTKRLVEGHNVQLLSSLLQKNSRKKITKVEFTRICLSFLLQKKLDVLQNRTFKVDMEFKEPDYVINNLIAGYYGNVSIESLQNAFQGCFPVYQETPVTKTEQEIEPEIPEIGEIMEIEAWIAEQPESPAGPSCTKKLKCEKPSMAKETKQALEHLFKDSKARLNESLD